MFHNTLSNPYSCPISLSWLFTTLSTLSFSLPCLFFFFFLFMRFYFPFWLLIVNAVSKDARFCLLFYCYCCNSRLAALSPGRPLCFSSYSFELRESKLCVTKLSCSKIKESDFPRKRRFLVQNSPAFSSNGTGLSRLGCINSFNLCHVFTVIQKLRPEFCKIIIQKHTLLSFLRHAFSASRCPLTYVK